MNPASAARVLARQALKGLSDKGRKPLFDHVARAARCPGGAPRAAPTDRCRPPLRTTPPLINPLDNCRHRRG